MSGVAPFTFRCPWCHSGYYAAIPTRSGKGKACPVCLGLLSGDGVISRARAPVAAPVPRPAKRKGTPSSERRKDGVSARRCALLVERDGSDCHLCGEPVDPDADGDFEPSVDHLKPLSHGGTNKLSNLKLAHRGCNLRRGNALLPEPDRSRSPADERRED